LLITRNDLLWLLANSEKAIPAKPEPTII